MFFVNPHAIIRVKFSTFSITVPLSSINEIPQISEQTRWTLKTITIIVVRNAEFASSGYTLKLSIKFFNQRINQLINRVYLEIIS